MGSLVLKALEISKPITGCCKYLDAPDPVLGDARAHTQKTADRTHAFVSCKMCVSGAFVLYLRGLADEGICASPSRLVGTDLALEHHRQRSCPVIDRGLDIDGFGLEEGLAGDADNESDEDRGEGIEVDIVGHVVG